jgi:hypothetical protein
MPHHMLYANPTLAIVQSDASHMHGKILYPHTIIQAFIQYILMPYVVSDDATAGSPAADAAAQLTATQLSSTSNLALHYTCDYMMSLHSNYMNYIYTLHPEVKETVKMKATHYNQHQLISYLLTLTPKQAELILGKPDAQSLGKQEDRLSLHFRQFGYLDSYLGYTDVAKLLVEMGYVSIQQHQPEVGIYYLLLAESYTEALQAVVHACMQQLHRIASAAGSASGGDDEQAKYWLEYVRHFVEKYLGVTGISQALASDRQGRIAVQTLQEVVLPIYEIIYAYKIQGHVEDALQHMATLHILPTSDHSQASLLQTILTNSTTHDIADAFVIMIAQCIMAVYCLWKQMKHVSNMSSIHIDTKLRTCIEYAQGLYSFIEKYKQHLTRPDKTIQELNKILNALL